MIKKWGPLNEWRFEEREGHALLAALKRHRDDLMLACEEKEILIPSQAIEIYERILKTPCVMAPTKNDVFIFDFLAKKELEYLEAHEEEELPECGCDTSEHVRSLIEWYTRNLM